MPQSWIKSNSAWLALVLTLAAIALTTALAPVERTLGALARPIYFHGAWVWAGKIAFAAAGIAGLVGLLMRSNPRGKTWLRASLALGWVGLFFWATYLPVSLVVQKLSWGGIFWDEPRWRVPFMLGVVGLLLQLGLWLLENLRLAGLANLAFGAALWYFLGNVQNVLHPDSPIFDSGAVRIQFFFVLLVALSLIFGTLLAWLLFRRFTGRWQA